VDIIGDAGAERYDAALRLLVEDENIDGIIPIWTPTLMAEAPDIARIITEVGKKCDKPILACIQTMGPSAEIRRILLEDRIPWYQFPENAARAMAAMAQFSRWSQRPKGEVTIFHDVEMDVARRIISEARARKPMFLSEPEGHTILKAYGLPCRVPAGQDRGGSRGGRRGDRLPGRHQDRLTPDPPQDGGRGVRVGIKDGRRDALRVRLADGRGPVEAAGAEIWASWCSRWPRRESRRSWG